MEPTRLNYEGIAFGVPFGIFVLLFMIMTFINRRANAFIMGVVLGIKLKSDENSSAQTINEESKDFSLNHHVQTFLYVDQGTTEHGKQKGLPCILRFFSDLLSSAILTVLLEIIFDDCILSYKTIQVGDWCPEYETDCFGYANGTRNAGPFRCTSGEMVNFSVTGRSVACFAWKYDEVGARDVLEAVGVTGGLLGIVACIVPLVFYLSFYKRVWRTSIICVILPLMVSGVFGVVSWYAQPQVVSLLTIITFSLLIFMTCGAWIWAIVKSFRIAEPKP